MSRKISFIVVLALLTATIAETALANKSAERGVAGLISVPAGNRNATSPAAPGNSVARRKSENRSIEGKYAKVMKLLRKDRSLRETIKKVSSMYGIERVLMYGAIVGEHSYNYDVFDTAQSYVQMGLTYFSQLRGNRREFSANGGRLTLDEFLKYPEIRENCRSQQSYEFWSCAETTWNSKFMGKVVRGLKNDSYTFNMAFFNPMYTGQTYGLGQLSPLAALKVSDMVANVSGIRLVATDAGEVYRTIMDPTKSLHFVAAIIKTSVLSYAQIAGFDITTNPGVVATLYNLGQEKARAHKLKKANSAGQRVYPEENFVGWLVNHKIAEIRELAQ